MNELQMIRYTRDEVNELLALEELRHPTKRLESTVTGLVGALEFFSIGLALGIGVFLVCGLAHIRLPDSALVVLFLAMPGLLFLFAFWSYLWRQSQRLDIKAADEEFRRAWRRLSYKSDVPPDYWTPAILDQFERFLEEGRASSLAECIALVKKTADAGGVGLKERTI